MHQDVGICGGNTNIHHIMLYKTARYNGKKKENI